MECLPGRTANKLPTLMLELAKGLRKLSLEPANLCDELFILWRGLLLHSNVRLQTILPNDLRERPAPDRTLQSGTEP